MKPDYKVSNTCILIYNSYLTPKKEYRPTLEEIKEDHPDKDVVKNRSITGMCLEWAVHSFLYNFLKYEEKRTKDTDLEWPRSTKDKILYAILGILVWPWLK